MTDNCGEPVSPLTRFTLLGVGAMNSPRHAPAGLLIEQGRVRVAIDGGPGAEPVGPLAAWLVTDVVIVSIHWGSNWGYGVDFGTRVSRQPGGTLILPGPSQLPASRGGW